MSGAKPLLDGKVVIVTGAGSGIGRAAARIRVGGMAVGGVAQLGDLVQFAQDHALRPVIDRCFPLADLGEAFRYQLTGAHLGKIVVTL